VRVLQATGRALLWAVAAAALSAALGAVITEGVANLVGEKNVTDLVDAVVGLAVVLGGVAGLVLALAMPRARPAQRIATALGSPFRALERRMSGSPLRKRQNALVREHPVQAAIVYGGAWGLLMFAAAPLQGTGYTVDALFLALLFGVGGFGPFLVWLARRRGQ